MGPTATTTASAITSTPTTSLKQLSWPEQLARNKAARMSGTSVTATSSSTTTTTTTTTGTRHSIDSMDSMEMELAGSETIENGSSNPIPPSKKAIILPILGKKKNMLPSRSSSPASGSSSAT